MKPKMSTFSMMLQNEKPLKYVHPLFKNMDTSIENINGWIRLGWDGCNEVWINTKNNKYFIGSVN